MNTEAGAVAVMFIHQVATKKQVFLYYKVTHTAIKYEFFKPVDTFCKQTVLFPTARTTRRRNLMLGVGNKTSVVGASILPVALSREFLKQKFYKSEVCVPLQQIFAVGTKYPCEIHLDFCTHLQKHSGTPTGDP